MFSLPLEILFGRPRWLPGENKHFSGLFCRCTHAHVIRVASTRASNSWKRPSIHLPTIISNITHLFSPSAKLPFSLEIDQSPPFHPVLSLFCQTLPAFTSVTYDSRKSINLKSHPVLWFTEKDKFSPRCMVQKFESCCGNQTYSEKSLSLFLTGDQCSFSLNNSMIVRFRIFMCNHIVHLLHIVTNIILYFGYFIDLFLNFL